MRVQLRPKHELLATYGAFVRQFLFVDSLEVYLQWGMLAEAFTTASALMRLLFRVHDAMLSQGGFGTKTLATNAANVGFDT